MLAGCAGSGRGQLPPSFRLYPPTPPSVCTPPRPLLPLHPSSLRVYPLSMYPPIRLVLLITPCLFYYNIFLPCWDCYDFESAATHEECIRSSHSTPPHRSFDHTLALAAHERFPFWPAHTHTQSHTHRHTQTRAHDHTRTLTHTHACARARAHTRTHAHRSPSRSAVTHTLAPQHLSQHLPFSLPRPLLCHRWATFWALVIPTLPPSNATLPALTQSARRCLRAALLGKISSLLLGDSPNPIATTPSTTRQWALQQAPPSSSTGSVHL